MTPKNVRDRQLRNEAATLREENAELRAILAKTEEALQQSEERYRVISQVVFDWVYGIRFEPSGEVVREWATDAFVRISGFTDEELDAAGGWASVVHPDDQPIMTKRVQALRSGKPDVSEYRIVTKSGEIRWLRDHGRPVSDGARGGSIRVYGAVQDITYRKRAEEDLRKARDELERRVADRTADLAAANAAMSAEVEKRRTAQEALQTSEDRLRLLLERTNAIPWIADGKTFQFTYVGPQAVGLLGYEIDQWYEQDFWPDHIHPDDREDAITTCLESSRCFKRYEFEYRMIAADGRIVWLHDLISVVHENGEPALLQGFMIDITERKRLEAEAAAQREELAFVTRVATMGELAASLAHELNQPLAAMVSNAQAAKRLLDSEPPNLDDVRDAAIDIANDGKRAGKVIHSLRKLIKRGERKPVPMDVNEIIRETIILIHGDTVTRQVSLETRLAADLPAVHGDRVQIQQVVLNLILNGAEAVRLLDDDERELVVSTSRGPSNTIEVTVRDSGIGLEPKTIDRLFGPFFTTKPNGLGMGLSICRSIVESHGGRIWATQNPDRGTTFHFTLPTITEGSSVRETPASTPTTLAGGA